MGANSDVLVLYLQEYKQVLIASDFIKDRCRLLLNELVHIDLETMVRDELCIPKKAALPFDQALKNSVLTCEKYITEIKKKLNDMDFLL